MPLTPEDVSNKRFTPVRLREGYDMGEVDAFLDEVESELARLIRENSELRRSALATQGGEPVTAVDGAAEQPVAASNGVAGAVADGTELHAPATAMASEAAQDGSGDTTAPAASAPTTGAAAPREPETIVVRTAAEASSAATRLLELATRSAEELVGEAQTQAEQILADARAESERLEAESRTRWQQLDADTETRRAQLLGDLDAERERLNSEVEDLRGFEREYRGRLRTYFEQQLAALHGSGEDGLADRPSTLGGDSPSG